MNLVINLSLIVFTFYSFYCGFRSLWHNLKRGIKFIFGIGKGRTVQHVEPVTATVTAETSGTSTDDN